MWKPCLPGVIPPIFHEISHGASAAAWAANQKGVVREREGGGRESNTTR
jgi:hypothetical protein